ncbi:sulfurtransferase TusA family protein [Alicyclobacillus fastidiosus]|uniref:Sulfurtransferase TusA family protein n=1 Tax=Alicyclobacillus fastidiosus TaxID=392011 RepID=A0ABY6ZPP1_9BACL|nr:sulfurtransferase TusA family protein [Alicyclobacillus fastidiosus]WAH44051.1 sulfurtransferase TusA family protein [Alicyclobacillus fastidiosus]GMA60337.1 hypothetical protein GCM10025859_07770 [Alicyclobacillus fastidiosus]
MSTFAVDQSLDCKGLSCPMPIVRTKKAIDQMEPGQVLEVVATDPGSVADVKGWASRTGHQFLGTQTEDKVFRHYIRKSRPEETEPEKTFPHVISNEELEQKLAEGPVILDVREPAEYAFSHIPGAILVPMGQLEERIEELTQYKNQPVFVVCRTGNRSDVACQILAEHGFQNVKNVVPGMSDWQGPTKSDV